MFDPGTVICREFPDSTGWLAFGNPREVLEARDCETVRKCLDRAREAARRGLWAAGWIAYEAAPAFDAACRVRTPAPELPLLWMGVYDEPQVIQTLPDPAAAGACRVGPWTPRLDKNQCIRHIERIRELIASGDTYQVNFAHHCEADFDGDPARLFLELAAGNHGAYSAFIRTARHAIVSTSPELFFMQNGSRLQTRPMKGTSVRGRDPDEDNNLAERLRNDPKERAENVMIVDLLRNDLGRVARTGTVQVSDLFKIERYETVLQMTSTVTALTDADPVAALTALFPCGSVTGAPKIRTMEIIAELEAEPRGVYTGAIGWLGPQRRACFNVPIRTIEIDLEERRARYGVGSGITWDSNPAAEHAEMLAKTRVLGITTN